MPFATRTDVGQDEEGLRAMKLCNTCIHYKSAIGQNFVDRCTNIYLLRNPVSGEQLESLDALTTRLAQGLCGMPGYWHTPKL